MSTPDEEEEVDQSKQSSSEPSVSVTTGTENMPSHRSHSPFNNSHHNNNRHLYQNDGGSAVIQSPKCLTLSSCSKDPCGIICMFITYTAVFYADYVVTKWIVMTTFVSLWGTFHVVVFNIIVGLLLMAHLRAVFTDPGFVTTKYHVDDDYLRGVNSSDSPEHEQGPPPSVPANYTLCPRCDIYRPPRAHHCRICKKCIRRMDHHCPWVNNCVGEFNQKYFIQFLFYVGLLSAYSMGLVLYTWVESSQSPDGDMGNRWHFNNFKMNVHHYVPPEVQPPGANQVGSQPINSESHIVKQTRILHSVILMLESLLFGLFVLAILIDQFSAIFTDETIVEQHISGKNTRPSSAVPKRRRSSGTGKRSKMDLLRDVCGSGHFLWWLLPCHTRDDVIVEKRMNEVV